MDFYFRKQIHKKWDSMMHRLIFCLTVGLTVSCAAEAQATVDIDVFDQTSQFVADPTPTTSSESVALEAIGGHRFLEVTRTTGTGTVTGFANPLAGSDGEFNFSAQAGTTGMFTLNYNGSFADDNATNATITTNNYDLLEGGANTGFLFQALAQFGLKLAVTIYNDGTAYTAMKTIPSSTATTLQNYFLPFSDFGVGADFANVDAIRIVGTNTDDGSNFRLNFSAAANPVPEPGSMTLFALGGLGLLGYGARRKRAQSAA
ncbi:PEP-CTERM sorting domain-containing protein [Thalassoroseus pseudoceratinae]|uniref:PEP-CTERM sorting domain-containing protein n=1 Tax=Thalassoroseus pseudoceratinae TaxID=2713176 RepID=UPI0014224EB7|nr:PEP-CTERM sorting domain-containing protein [Thalassoroseus pseudoceratinae]